MKTTNAAPKRHKCCPPWILFLISALTILNLDQSIATKVKHQKIRAPSALKQKILRELGMEVPGGGDSVVSPAFNIDRLASLLLF